MGVSFLDLKYSFIPQCLEDGAIVIRSRRVVIEFGVTQSFYDRHVRGIVFPVEIPERGVGNGLKRLFQNMPGCSSERTEP